MLRYPPGHRNRIRRSPTPGRGIQVTALSSRTLISTRGTTSSALTAAVTAQCSATCRRYLATMTVTACADSTSSDNSFR